MNEWEIDNAIDRWREHPVLGPAVLTLDSLRDVTNANSDGWHTWMKPANAAGQLQALIAAASWRPEDPRYAEPTEEALRKALAPIKAFRTKMIKTQTERYGEAGGQRWNFQITERLPTQRERLERELEDAERTASGHRMLAERWTLRAAEVREQLSQCGNCGCPA